MNFSPFTIIVDNAEQLPYRFDEMKVGRRKVFTWTKVKSLDTGDYSIEGYESRVTVERKSLADLYGTLSRSRDRFERELQRMTSFERSIIIIEADWRLIAWPDKDDPLWASSVSPNSILGTMFAWSQKYPGTRWKAAKDRRTAEKETFQFLLDWYNTAIVNGSNEQDHQGKFGQMDAGETGYLATNVH